MTAAGSTIGGKTDPWPEPPSPVGAKSHGRSSALRMLRAASGRESSGRSVCLQPDQGFVLQQPCSANRNPEMVSGTAVASAPADMRLSESLEAGSGGSTPVALRSQRSSGSSDALQLSRAGSVHRVPFLEDLYQPEEPLSGALLTCVGYRIVQIHICILYAGGEAIGIRAASGSTHNTRRNSQPVDSAASIHSCGLEKDEEGG